MFSRRASARQKGWLGSRFHELSGDESAPGGIRPWKAQETSGASGPCGFGASAGRRAQSFVTWKLKRLPPTGPRAARGRGQLRARARLLKRNHWSRPGRCFPLCRTDAAIIGFAQGGERGKAAVNFCRPIAGCPFSIPTTTRPLTQNHPQRAGQVRRRRLGHLGHEPAMSVLYRLERTTSSCP